MSTTSASFPTTLRICSFTAFSYRAIWTIDTKRVMPRSTKMYPNESGNLATISNPRQASSACLSVEQRSSRSTPMKISEGPAVTFPGRVTANRYLPATVSPGGSTTRMVFCTRGAFMMLLRPTPAESYSQHTPSRGGSLRCQRDHTHRGHTLSHILFPTRNTSCNYYTVTGGTMTSSVSISEQGEQTQWVCPPIYSPMPPRTGCLRGPGRPLGSTIKLPGILG